MSATHKTGFTLIEVVIGTVLMASLISGALVALSQFQSHHQRSLDRSEACGAADRLLDLWTSQPGGVPRRAFGTTSNGRFTWRTEVIGTRTLMNTPVSIVQLTLRRSDQPLSRRASLVRLELPVRNGQR